MFFLRLLLHFALNERRSAFVRASTTSFDSYTHTMNDGRRVVLLVAMYAASLSVLLCVVCMCVCVVLGSRCSSQIFDHDVGFEAI